MAPQNRLFSWYFIQLIVVALISTGVLFLKGYTERSEWLIYELCSVVCFSLLVILNLFFLKINTHTSCKISMIVIVVGLTTLLLTFSNKFHAFSPAYLVFLPIGLIPAIFYRKLHRDALLMILIANCASIFFICSYFNRFIDSLLPLPYLLYLFVFFVIVMCVAMYLCLRNKRHFLDYFDENKHWTGGYSFFLYTIGAIAFILFLIYRTIPDIHHYSFYIGPTYELSMGKSLLKDTPSQYGYLSIYFIWGLLQYFGVSFQSFHILNILLYFLYIGSTFFIYRKILKNVFSSIILCIISAIFQTLLYGLTYGIFPSTGFLRFGIGLGIVFILLLLPKKIKIGVLTVVCALSLFWSVETSIYVVPAGLYVLLSYCISNTRSIKQTVLLYIKKVGLFFLVGAGAFLLIITYEYINFHSLPRLGSYFDFVLIYRKGFGSLPIPLFGNYYIAIAILILGLVLSTYSLFKKYSSGLFLALHFLCIHNVAIFSYFIGRSHENNIINISIFLLLELVVCYKVIETLFFTDENKRNAFIAYALLPIILFVLLFMSTILTRLITQGVISGIDRRQLLIIREYSDIKQRHNLNKKNVIVVGNDIDTFTIVENNIYPYLPLNPSAMTILVHNYSQKYITPNISKIPLGTFVVIAKNETEILRVLRTYLNLKPIDLNNHTYFDIYKIVGKR